MLRLSGDLADRNLGQGDRRRKKPWVPDWRGEAGFGIQVVLDPAN